MKKFNEWLSFKSNVYEEVKPLNAEEMQKFNFSEIPASKNVGSVKNSAERLSKLVNLYGERNNKFLLANIIKDIYDFSSTDEINNLKRDLRYLSNHIEENNNLDIPESEQE